MCLEKSHSFRILFDSPELLEVQRAAFYTFLKEGIAQELKKKFPLKVKSGTTTIELDVHNFKLLVPEDTPQNCILKMKTYSSKLYVQVKTIFSTSSLKNATKALLTKRCFLNRGFIRGFVSHEFVPYRTITLPSASLAKTRLSYQSASLKAKLASRSYRTVLEAKSVHAYKQTSSRYQTKAEWILIGQLPLMTKRGHFIINGSPRVIVHQIVRSPGIYFQKLLQKDQLSQKNKARFYGDIIPLKGVWVRLQLTKKGRVEARFKKGKKVQLELLQKCLQVIESQASKAKLVGLPCTSAKRGSKLATALRRSLVTLQKLQSFTDKKKRSLCFGEVRKADNKKLPHANSSFTNQLSNLYNGSEAFASLQNLSRQRRKASNLKDSEEALKAYTTSKAFLWQCKPQKSLICFWQRWKRTALRSFVRLQKIAGTENSSCFQAKSELEYKRKNLSQAEACKARLLVRSRNTNTSNTHILESSNVSQENSLPCLQSSMVAASVQRRGRFKTSALVNEACFQNKVRQTQASRKQVGMKLPSRLPFLKKDSRKDTLFFSFLEKNKASAESRAEQDAFVHTYDKLYRTAEDKELEIRAKRSCPKRFNASKKTECLEKPSTQSLRALFAKQIFISKASNPSSIFSPLNRKEAVESYLPHFLNEEQNSSQSSNHSDRLSLRAFTKGQAAKLAFAFRQERALCKACFGSRHKQAKSKSLHPHLSKRNFLFPLLLRNRKQGFAQLSHFVRKRKQAELCKARRESSTCFSNYLKKKNFTSEKSFKRKKCSENLFSTFKMCSRYSLGELGREKMNSKLGIFETDQQLTSTDLFAASHWLYKLRGGEESVDDIDHSQNRRVRTSGELLQMQFENGVDRLQNLLLGKLKEWSSILDSSYPLLVQHQAEERERTQGIQQSFFPRREARKQFCQAKQLTPSFGSWPLRNQSNGKQGKPKEGKFKRFPTEVKLGFGSSKGVHLLQNKAFDELVNQPVHLVGREKREVSSSFVSVDTLCKAEQCKAGLLIGKARSTLAAVRQVVPLQACYRASQKQRKKEGNRKKSEEYLWKVKASIKELFSAKAINGALREFFGSNPLSQYMDQTNPLAEMTHKRRMSSLGTGGVSRESAGMAIRGIHPTHYGRICPIETPEGKNAGLVNSLAFYTKLDKNGFLETPYYQVFKGQVQSELGFSFCSAKKESLASLQIAPSDLQQSWGNILRTDVSTADFVPVRIADNLLDIFQKINAYKVDAIGISPIQMISVATALIPFLEHNDANRALMGSNMQRQAVPLMISERAIVSTGFECRVLIESGHITQSSTAGFISYVSATQIIVERLLDYQAKQLQNMLPKSRFLVPFRGKEDYSVSAEKAGSVGKSRQALYCIKCTASPQLQQDKQSSSSLATKTCFGSMHKQRQVKESGQTAKNVQLLPENAKLLPLRTAMFTKRIATFTESSKCFILASQLQGGTHSFDTFRKQGFYKAQLSANRARAYQSLNNLELLTKACLSRNKKRVLQKSRRKASRFIHCVHPLQTFIRSNQNTCITQKALVRESDWVQKGDVLTDCSASEKGSLAVGKNVLLAYIPWEGYNFEDAIVISERLVKEHVYTSLHIERYIFHAQELKEGTEWFTRDLPGLSRSQVNHLDEFGLPQIGSFLKEGDILVGKIRYLNKKAATPYERLLCDILGEKSFSARNQSLYVPKGVEARVLTHRVITLFQSESENKLRPAGSAKTVHIFLAEKRGIQVGDKMSGRHGNKGVISSILPRQDMPYLPDGTAIDIILNPLGVPSRMNVGQVLECLFGLAASYLQQHFQITAFDELYGIEASQSLVYLKLYQARLQSQQNWLFQLDFPGKTRLVDGRSGECFSQWITVGKAYILKLIHMVSEKIHARGTGPYALITQQPLRGRSNKGGQRLGEMEVWALEGFGAAYTLQELLTKKSDDFWGRKEIVDSILPKKQSQNGKGTEAAFATSFPAVSSSIADLIQVEQRVQGNTSRTAKLANAERVLGHAEIFKVLLCELQALCLDVGVYVLTRESFQRSFVGVIQ